MLGKQHWLAEWENVTNFWLDANIWDLCICLRAHRRILHKGVTWRSQGFMWLTYRQNTSWINYFNLKNTLLSHYSYFSGLFYLLIPVWVTHTISHAYACPKLQKAVWYSHTYTHLSHAYSRPYRLSHYCRHRSFFYLLFLDLANSPLSSQVTYSKIKFKNPSLSCCSLLRVGDDQVSEREVEVWIFIPDKNDHHHPFCSILSSIYARKVSFKDGHN